MKVIEFLRNGGTLESLEAQYAVTAKRHGTYPNLVLLKYSQLDSPMSEIIVQECRSLILDESNDWNVVSRSYNKFFNYGEGHAAPLDWSSAKAYEKLDGSLMSVYWYDGKWNVSTSGMPDAAGEVNQETGLSFANLFWRTWHELGYKMPPYSDYTYMFELMTPENRVVVPHSTRRIVWHGLRRLNNVPLCGTAMQFGENPVCYSEIDPARFIRNPYIFDDSNRPNWEIVKFYPLQSIEDVISAAAALNPMQNEGFVIVDASFNRIKVKSPQYVALSHMKDQFSERRMLEIARTNESEEFLTYFPDMRETFDKAKMKFNALVKELTEAYEKIKHIVVQKDFALEAQKVRCSGALFSVRAKKADSISQYLANMSITGLEKIL